MLGLIFEKAQNKIQDPAKLRQLVVELVGKENWSAMSADVKGDAYEGLLERNAQDVKGGAGQYFTPRVLIDAIVDCVRPHPGEIVADPACGTGGFLLSAHEYVKNHFELDRDQKRHLRFEALGVLLCDMQDVGARFYTRIETMTLAMEAASKANKAVVVFDRPNPIGLRAMEGPPLTWDVGLIGRVWPGQKFGLPTRTGLTMGEIAVLVNSEWTAHKADLTVIKVPGYTRAMTFEATGYPWVMPSPNMPTLETAFVYTGTCVFEGTNISEGRGTTRPFELIGAPFVNAPHLTDRLNAAGLKGVSFRAAWFVPTFDDHAGKLCAGSWAWTVLSVLARHNECSGPRRARIGIAAGSLARARPSGPKRRSGHRSAAGPCMARPAP